MHSQELPKEQIEKPKCNRMPYSSQCVKKIQSGKCPKGYEFPSGCLGTITARKKQGVVGELGQQKKIINVAGVYSGYTS